MLLRVLPPQIPKIWDSVKYTIMKVAEVKEKDYQTVFNYTLRELLSEKMQCWVRLNEERRLVALLLSEIRINKITGEKDFMLSLLYSWRPTANDEWISDLDEIKIFAKKAECARIIAESSSQRMWNIYELNGFKESIRRYIYEVI